MIELTYNKIINRINEIYIIIQIIFINWMKKYGVLVRKPETLDD
jgi:hypothetical protein